MEEKTSKKYLILVLILVLVALGFLIYKLSQNKGPSQERKAEIVDQLNKESEGKAPVSIEVQNEIIDKMNESSANSAPDAADEKSKLIKEYR